MGWTKRNERRSRSGHRGDEEWKIRQRDVAQNLMQSELRIFLYPSLKFCLFYDPQIAKHSLD